MRRISFQPIFRTTTIQMNRLKYARQLLFSRHPYFAGLPMNSGWQAKLPAAAQQSLHEGGIRVFDIGARNLSYDELNAITNLVDYSAFDADATECRRISQARRKYSKQRVINAFIGQEAAEIEFHLYRTPGSSSVFYPSQRYAEQFCKPGQATIERTCKMRSRSLDGLIAEYGLEYPHLLKLDTQGSELAILKAAPEVLRRCLMVELEAEFIEQYQGQPLFYDICRFMYDSGYEVYHINRVYKQRALVYSGMSRGQLLFGDFLFVRRDEHWDGMSIDDAAVLCVLLWNFGHIDAAFVLFSKRLVASKQYAALRGLFEERNYESLRNRMVQFIFGKIDAFVATYLLFRRSNRLRSEQDRAWPIR